MYDDIGQAVAEGIQSPEKIIQSVTQCLQRAVVAAAGGREMKDIGPEKLGQEADIPDIGILHYKELIVEQETVV